MTEIDTSKEAIKHITDELRAVRRLSLYGGMAHGSACIVEALATERDAAVARVEKAEATNTVYEDRINALRYECGEKDDEIGILRARVAAMEGAINKGLDAFTALAGQSNDPSVNAIQNDAIASMGPALSAAPQPATVKESLTTAAADVLAAVRKLGVKEHGWKTGDDAESMGEGDGELGLAAALYLLPYEATVGGEKLLKQDDFIRLDMILELTCGWSLKPIPDRRERLVQGVAFGLAEIERLDRARTGSGEGER